MNLGGDGNVGTFFFYNGKSVSYRWIDERLDKIDSKLMMISVGSCYGGSSIKDLEGGNRIIITSSSDKELGSVGTSYEFLKAFINTSADNDSSGYISISEAAEYVKEVDTFVDISDPTNPNTNRTPQISDIGNLGVTSYLAELKLGT